jgi:hypothetical protein
MNGDMTADGTSEEAGDHSPDRADGAFGVLHVLAGYHLSGAGVRAVCRCGHTGPPRAVEDRAAAALDEQHRLDPLQCGVCERQRVPDTILCRPEEVGLVIRPAVAGPLPDVEFGGRCPGRPRLARPLRQPHRRPVAHPRTGHLQRLHVRARAEPGPPRLEGILDAALAPPATGSVTDLARR